LRYYEREPGKHEYKGKTLNGVKDGDSWVTWPELIETRGTGGQVAIFPSTGCTILQPGELAPYKPPKITAVEREILIQAARSFDERHPVEKKQASLDNGTRPGDEYNAQISARQIYDLMTRHGWQKHSTDGNAVHVTRPGKDVREGKSGTLYDTGVFHCFSSNAAPFEEGQDYSPFAVYANLEHDGDFSRAAKHLSKGGFGKATTKTAKPPDPKKLAARCCEILDSQNPTGAFDTSALPADLANYINDLSQTTDAHPIIITQSALCTASAFLGKARHLPESTAFVKLYANLWALSICGSGTFKTTALRKGIRLALEIETRVSEAVDLFQKEMAKLDTKKDEGAIG